MSRVQLALNVSDLEASVEFYSRLFNTTPHKRRPGYANFAINEPPLKLVLIQASAEERGEGVAGALNHLGIEVEDSAAVSATAQRLSSEGVEVTDINRTVCCYAEQDKTWAHDPAGAPWEIYTITDDLTDALVFEPMIINQVGGSACCTPATSDAVEASTCC
ncbi:MAG: ArsI/CadI family heavy metal resistance metalloenzyme [Actinomycetota bacterium]|nr:ArsI/CadI family heavy metal resistance metalloenzyme [Actinomycetota bacterium]MDP2287712.1 ArsI/CadI family heavy metal resistance metalloenzyme [Actinomycetota bacterium]